MSMAEQWNVLPREMQFFSIFEHFQTSAGQGHGQSGLALTLTLRKLVGSSSSEFLSYSLLHSKKEALTWASASRPVYALCSAVLRSWDW